ncbi:MAG: hypothetical protein KVP17_003811 [Porospora cf. gigantea B]|uniref:uncharacterized protein n=1 Tax=Porospora cf. gigantea B TaxID=2853592 RepID=UPI0035717B94|nr:MAG: hypothetical protein KVP17_003811 [Porospora cf. gigantea B]
MAAGSVYAKHSGKLLALLYLLQPVAAADKPEGDQLVRLAFTPLSLLVSVQAPSKDLSVMCEVPAATFSVYEVRDCGVFPQNYEPTTCGTTGRPPSNLSVVFFVNIHLLIAAIASVDSLHDVVLNFNQTNCRLNVAVRSPPVKVVASLAVQCFDVPDEWPPQVDSASEVALPGLFFYTLIKRCVSHCSPRSLIILSLRPADSAGEARFGIRVSEHCSTCCEVELPYSSNSLSDLKCIQPLECLFNSRTLMQCAKAVSSCGEVRFIFPIEPNSRGAGVCRPVCALVKTSLKTLPISRAFSDKKESWRWVAVLVLLRAAPWFDPSEADHLSTPDMAPSPVWAVNLLLTGLVLLDWRGYCNPVASVVLLTATCYNDFTHGILRLMVLFQPPPSRIAALIATALTLAVEMSMDDDLLWWFLWSSSLGHCIGVRPSVNALPLEAAYFFSPRFQPLLSPAALFTHYLLLPTLLSLSLCRDRPHAVRCLTLTLGFAMLAATVLKDHLMFLSVFAPRVAFEAARVLVFAIASCIV